jgi:two-component system chemotaxis sensor kinase CheA
VPDGNLELPEEKPDIEKDKEKINNENEKNTKNENKKTIVEHSQAKQQKYINVNVEKLDLLMNLVGELVVSEAMVTQNPELKSLNIQSIEKSAAQMRKIINEVQDIVMEIRMVPLAMTFQRMNRIVRDMSVKTNKEVDLVLLGQETEVDKNIIEHISDPLMHLIRNAIDHGIETTEERKQAGKPEKGTVTLEAKNSGGDVWIIVRDDGKGLEKEKILQKADKKGLLKKPMEEYSDKEAFSLIFEAGLSTKEAVTNFSGRGVGMDAVVKELEKIGGIAVVESEIGKGTYVTLRIPLTLAIINGMVMNVGENKFTLPITSIRESFKAKKKDIITDTDGNEMILVRGECYSVIRIHERYALETEIDNLEEGIMVMLENEDSKICLFVDQLIGEHQVVVKSFSKYIQKIQGISGCAHLGDGGICLILDPSGLIA